LDPLAKSIYTNLMQKPLLFCKAEKLYTLR